MASSKLMIVAVVIAIASFCVPSTVAQTRHVVGDAFGWAVPADGTATYINWASKQTFVVGDTLLFNFTTGNHDVAEVSQAAFGPCTTATTISNNPTGPATITLSSAGNHYYVCTFGSHCSLGQKLSITVSASSSTTPPPTGSTTPPATGSTTPPPAGSTTPSSPSPPSPSSASSFSVVGPITFLAAALAFFY